MRTLLYRGYFIHLARSLWWWAVEIQPSAVGLPLLVSPHFRWRGSEAEALAEAKTRIDIILLV
jgi:hypothetical protein